MPAAPLPSNETQRLQSLCDAAILDTGLEFFFDECVDTVGHLISAPMTFVSFVDQDRQWFKASRGLDVIETPRTCAFCAYAILNDAPLVVADAREDVRFRDSPLVTGAPHIAAYIGAPIILDRGSRIGAVCAADIKPREWTPSEVANLVVVADMAASYVVLRRRLLQLNRQRYFDIMLNGGYVPD